MDRKLRQVLTVLLLASAAGVFGQGSDDNPDAAESGRAATLTRILRGWSMRPPFPDEIGDVELTCIATPAEEGYVGIARRMVVRASLSAVEEVLDDIVHYKDLFPDTVDVRVVPGSRSASRFATRWEQRIPMFFLPNIKYELAHVVDKTVPGRRVYRYRLRHGDRLIASDGLVVIEASGPQSTRFTEYGFFLAHAGPVPASVVWRESVRGAYLGNAAIKLKAENPEWTYERIAAESRRLLGSDEARVNKCLSARHANVLREELDLAGAQRR